MAEREIGKGACAVSDAGEADPGRLLPITRVLRTPRVSITGFRLSSDVKLSRTSALARTELRDSLS
jgi:hypothetical protein